MAKIENPTLIEQVKGILSGGGDDFRREISNIISVIDGIIPINTRVEFFNNVDPHFEKNQNAIYLPFSYLDLPIFKEAKNSFDNLYSHYIVSHEFGHAVQTALVRNGQEVDIKSSPRTSFLFNGSSQPHGINNFMKELFKEGFADCFAGLCLYKETGDINAFKKISKLRQKRYGAIKQREGGHYIHPNFNHLAPAFLASSIEGLKSKGQDIFKLPFFIDDELYLSKKPSIEKYIDRVVVRGSYMALLEELRTNDACLNSFRVFTQQLRANSSDFYLDENLLVSALKSHGSMSQTQIDDAIQYEKVDGVSLYFVAAMRRLSKEDRGVFTEKDLYEVLTDTSLKRPVDTSLKLMDIKPITYQTSLEHVREQISAMRKEANESKIKIKP